MKLRSTHVIIVAVVLVLLGGLRWFNSPAQRTGRLIAKLGPPGPWEWLLILTELQDGFYSRDDIVAKLAALGQGAVPTLVQGLKEEELPNTRSYIASALGEMGPAAKDAVPALVLALEDGSWGVRANAACALGKIGSTSDGVIPALEACLDDTGPLVRMDVATALVRLGKAETGIPILMRSLKDPSRTSERAEAARRLAHLGPAAQPAIPALAEALKDEAEYARLGAAEAFAILGKPDEAVPVLIDLLRNGRELRMREYAASALGQIGPAAEAAVPALASALDTRDEDRREAAAEALGNIGPAAREAVPALSIALRNRKAGLKRTAPGLVDFDYEGADSESARKAAAVALGKIGSEAKDAIPALREALKDDSAHVRRAAADALREIRYGSGNMMSYISQVWEWWPFILPLLGYGCVGVIIWAWIRAKASVKPLPKR